MQVGIGPRAAGQSSYEDLTGEAAPGAMHISFWPHAWAIPLVLMVGFAAGWYLRSLFDRALEDEHKALSERKIEHVRPTPRGESDRP